MADIYSPFYNTYPQGSPAYIGPSQGYFPDWNEFWNMASYFMGAQQGMARPIPGGFHVPYGMDPLTGISNDLSAPYLSGSRQFAYGADEEAFSRNLTSIVNQTLASLHLNLDDKQRDTVRQVTDWIARYGTSALDMAEKFLASNGMENDARNILGLLRQGVDALYGPGGPRVPMYSVLNTLGENVPLDQRDALLMNMVHQMAPVNGKLPGGYSYRQAASLMASAASMGYNPINAIDTNLAKEMAVQQMSSLAEVNNGVDDYRIRRLSELSASRNFSRLSEAGTYNQTLYGYVRDQGGYFDAANQFSSFLDIRNRLKGVKGFENVEINTFQDLINQTEKLTKLTKKKKTTDSQKTLINGIITDIQSIQKNVNADNYSVNVNEVLNNVKDLHRTKLQEQIQKIGIYSEDNEAQNKFVNAMMLREELSSYKGINLDYLAQDAVDANGNKTGRKNWQVRADNANEELRNLLTSYFSEEEGNLHGVYTNAITTLQDKDAERQVKFLEELNKAQTPEEKQQIMKKYADVSENMLSDLEFINRADQASQPYKQLEKAASNLQLALSQGGTPIEDMGQLMQFINKVTYGGVGNMSDTELISTVEQIGAAMLASHASGNDVMQLAGTGAQAALAVGGNAQQGAINAVRAGLAAREAALASHKIDPNKAQAVYGLAAARSNKSLVERTYNAISAFTEDKNINLKNNKYGELIQKIQNNESLTTEELDTLYRDSAKIMSSIGMSADQQHYYLNDDYTGASAEAASRAGTSWMANSTVSRDIMKDNISRRLKSETKMSDNNRKKIADFMSSNLGSLVENMSSLTDKSKAREFKEKLLSLVPDDMKPIIENIDAISLQRSMLHATHVAARRNGQTDEEFVTMARTEAAVQENRDRNNQMGYLRHIMPDINQQVWQNISGALANGTMSDVIKAIVTPVNGFSLNEEEQQRLIHVAAMSTILDKKHEGESGLKKEYTESARKDLNALYRKYNKDPEQLEFINKYLMNEKPTQEETKRFNDLAKNAGIDNPEELKGIVDEAQYNIKSKFTNQQQEETISIVREGDKQTVTPKDATTEHVSETNKKEGQSGTATQNKQSGEDNSSGSGSKKNDGSEDHPLCVQIVNKRVPVHFKI